MKNPPLALLLATILATALTGCSVRVDVSDQNSDEESRTAVEVDLFTNNPRPAPPVATSEKPKTVQPDRETASPPATPEPQPRWVEELRSSDSDRGSVTVVENVINIQHLNIERHHDTHYHFYEPQKSRESVKVRIEVDQESERDERCERLRREYEEKVAEWEKLFQR